MLVLSRRIGETIMIGEDIEITVVRVNSHQVRLGIKAPKDIEVYREEIFNKIKQEIETLNQDEDPDCE